MYARDTICALASGLPPSAIAIIRISGPRVRTLAGMFLNDRIPEPGRSAVRAVHDAAGVLIDKALVLFSAAPRSYTGEDMLEVHLHGGAAVIDHLMRALSEIEGVRLAQPGEFTRRAFENGKLDLIEAEGIADLIEAETPAQKAQALSQVSGGLSAIYEKWRVDLTEIMALCEALIDFPDEADVEQDNLQPLKQRLGEMISAFTLALGDRGIGEKIREGFRIAIVGPANAGKSSILNRLARREAAIVTDIAGTTRDVIEARVQIAGHIVWLADTAGLRKTSDLIEQEGIRRAELAASQADMRLHVIDGLDPCPPLLPVRSGDLVIMNKCDRAKPSELAGADLAVSALTGEGFDKFEAAISAFILSRASYSEAPVITRARHRMHLSEGLEALKNALTGFEDGLGSELAAEELRRAEKALSSIIGRIGVEDVLGAVFSRFCIGK